jgi:hypothetical protein
MDPHLDLAFSCAALGVIFGALVALPSPAALGRLETLRSPAWGIALPGALVVGTFGVLMLPSVATGLVLVASIVTPALAGIAVLAVLHGHRRRLALVASVPVLVAMLTGWPDQVAATIVTALGCLTIGEALVRLTPSPWLGIGVLAMCGLDVLLLSTGVGQAAARLLDAAVPGSGLPALDRAGVGPISADYPDLILAAVVGGILAGRGVQRRAGGRAVGRLCRAADVRRHGARDGAAGGRAPRARAGARDAPGGGDDRIPLPPAAPAAAHAAARGVLTPATGPIARSCPRVVAPSPSPPPPSRVGSVSPITSPAPRCPARGRRR